MATRKRTTKPKKSTRVTKRAKESAELDLTSQELTRAESSTLLPTKINRKRVVALGLIIIGLGLVLFWAYKFLVVAWVDQTPITRIEMYKQLEAKYGKAFLDQAVDETLVMSEAKKRGVSVSDQEVAAELKKVEDQQGGADKFNQLLQAQGLSLADVQKSLRLRLLITKMFGSNVTISADEVNKYIEDHKDQFTDTSDQTKQQVSDQLKFQKIGQAFNSWLTQAKAGNRIIRY